LTKTGVRPKRSRMKIALWTIIGLIVLFVLIQFVRYGRDHTNQPATNPFKWTSPQAEVIAKKWWLRLSQQRDQVVGREARTVLVAGPARHRRAP
jgi:hypothetical protein